MPELQSIPASVYLLLLNAAFFTYSLTGVWGLSLNSKALSNRLFFALATCLGTWALGIALSASAPNLSQAMFWRRFAALGWSPFYAILLHFFLILTGHRFLVRNVFMRILLYVPALVSILVFSLISSIANDEYRLVWTAFGWQNAGRVTDWSLFFNLYYIGYVAMVGFVISSWAYRKKSKRKRALLILLAVLLALAVGSLTDIFTRDFSRTVTPVTAPILIAITVLAIYRGVERREISGMAAPSISAEILDDEPEQERFFRNLGLSLVAIAVINFIRIVFGLAQWYETSMFSALIFTLGTVILLLPHTGISKGLRENAATFIVAISIPILQIWAARGDGFNSAWPIPLVFLYAASVFRRRSLIITILISAVVTQLSAWIGNPELVVTIAAMDYLIMILFYIGGAVVALFIQGIYRRRLSQQAAFAGFYQLVSAISQQLMNVTSESIEGRLEEILRDSGNFFGCAHASIVINGDESGDLEFFREWNRLPLMESAEAPHPEALIRQLSLVDSSRAISLAPTADCRLTGALAQLASRLEAEGVLYASPLEDSRQQLGYLILGYNSPPRDFTNGNSAETHANLKTIALLFSDILDKVSKERKIAYMAKYDALTGLPNRVLFSDRLKEELSYASREERLVGVMLLDLDAFKIVNDSLGHEGGDELIKISARRMKSCLREYDTISRFAGDEFTFIFPHLKQKSDMETIALKILRAIEEPTEILGVPHRITASAGISLYPTNGVDNEQLIKKADQAMYGAKQSGKNSFAFYSPQQEGQSIERMKILNELHDALDREEFLLYYQPQVSSADGTIIGLEALIRWNHPEKGIVPPADFISIVEESNLIHPVGNWVIETACRDLRSLMDQGVANLEVSVNLSLRQFLNPGLVNHVRDCVRKYRLKPAMLDLEITERLAMGELTPISDQIHELKHIGFSISIDDFGTEYSSLGRLSDLPIDKIKIDKQFVDSISSGDSASAIISFILELSRNLGLTVVAEGVETKEQLEFLKDRGCGEIQGYYYYRPMPLSELRAILSAGREISTRDVEPGGD